MAKTKSRGRRVSMKNDGIDHDVDVKVDDNDFEDEKSPQQLGPKTPFFGLVDSNELDYFKQAESTLNINAFQSDEERNGFITSLLEECQGKELKLVTNQICSKLMERLILFSTEKQLKAMFRQFQGHFASLAHHKYASHVLETLLVRSAALVQNELVDGVGETTTTTTNELVVDETMEIMFVQMLEEFYPYVEEMISHQYGSHVLRLLILIVAGKQLPSSTMSNSTLRSKKSKIARKMIEIKDNDDFNKAFEVPPSFRGHLRRICGEISKKNDTKRMREFAIHKIASPVLQLAIQVEGLVDKDRGLWHSVFLSESEGKDPQEEAFVEYLLSDPVGSHFLEATIKNGGARLKYIERLYLLYMKDRVLKLAKRSTTGVFIIQSLLFKLKPSEVEFMLDQIIPELTNLISTSEVQNLELGTNIIDASIQRGNYRREELIKQLFVKFAPNYNIQDHASNDSTEFLENTLELAQSTLGNTRDDWPTAEERRRTLFVEKLMDYEYNFTICTWMNLLALPNERFVQICKHGVFSHVVDKSMVVTPAKDGESKSIMILRKRFLNTFQGIIADLACNAYGSHIVDRLWDFTVLLNMYKDRIASELVADSHKVKESIYGKIVWKNWSMELFVRKKYDWKASVKEQEVNYYGENGDGVEASGRAKKPIELKMEQLFKNKNGPESTSNKRINEETHFSFEKKQKIRGRNR